MRFMLMFTLLVLIVACGGDTPRPGTGADTAEEPGSIVGGEEQAGEETEEGSSAQPPPEPTPEVREATSGRETILEIWYPYGGEGSQVLEQYWKAFEDSHPDIGIRAVFAANDLATNAKLFTAIAAGNPPDVTWVDGPQVAEWAARGALEPLDEFIAQAGITEDDFWAPSWRQTIYGAKVWALTFSSDPNFGFFWNKDIFKEAGLDPEKPPQTIEEVDQYNEKLAVVEGNRIERLGIIPWLVYGSANSMFTWGWVFGGEFYDYEAKKVTANNPNVVKALEWMVSYAEKYGPEQISGFMAGFGTGEQHPFIQGKIAMAPLGPWELPNIKKYAPDLNYGITFMPTGPGAEPHQAWVGGWTVGIPAGAKNKEAAFEFIKWLSTSDEATALSGTQVRGFPGYKQSPYYEKIKDDPELKPFYDILVEAKHQRPVMPAQAFYMGEVARAVDAAIYGEKTPQQALDEATTATQKELDRIIREGVE